MWSHHVIALWRHGAGAWRQLATSTADMILLTTWLDCGKRVIRVFSNIKSHASYGPYYGIELPNHEENEATPQWKLSLLREASVLLVSHFLCKDIIFIYDDVFVSI